MRTRPRAAVVTVLLSLAMLASPVVQGRAEAVLPGTNGLIAFQFGSGSGRDIWTIRSDGTGLRQLTRTGIAQAPRWAPSGRLLAYLRQAQGQPAADVWTIRHDGTGSRRVVTGVAPGEPPAWSSYGDELVVVREVAGGSDLWRVSLDGGGPGERLTFAAARGCFVNHPSWRGTSVVYARFCPEHEQLRIVDISSGRDRLVIGTPAAAGDIFWPDFTADGRIMFMSCGLAAGDPCTGLDVTTVRRDGAGLSVVTDFCGCWNGTSATDPSPAPDGRRHAVSYSDGDSQGLAVFAGTEMLWQCCDVPGMVAQTPDWQRRPA
jgi:Tol biopolymer transport system component